MSLIITSQVETRNGIELNSAYARLNVTDAAEGTALQINMDYYPTDQAFINKAMPTQPVKPIGTFQMPYNRQADGTDILMLAHEYAKAQLAAEGLDSTIAELG